MKPHISLITLAVADLERSRRFYVEGLGWEPSFVGDDVIMIRVGATLLLSLWSEEGFEAEVGPVRRGPGVAPITLAHNVGSEDEVHAVLTAARSAGATVHEAQRREWGGFSGYFADPDDFRWEVAHNPGTAFEFIVA